MPRAFQLGIASLKNARGTGRLFLECVGVLMLNGSVQTELCDVGGPVTRALTPCCDLIGS